MSELHPLAERFLDAIYELPDELRARKPLEQTLAAELTSGNHLAIRGFWRIGKTTLMKGVLQQACERTGGAAFFIDLRDPDTDDGMVPSVDAVLARIAAKVQEFLGRVGATELKADPKKPLEVLGELAAPIFVGFDELIALTKLGDAGAPVFEAMLTTPKNVKVVVVCHRHRDADALFEANVLSRPNVSLVFVPAISDEELVDLVQSPGLAEGVTFENEALGELAIASGNRPWELFTLGFLVASKLKPDFKGAITADQVAEVMTLDVIADTEEGQAVVQNALRVLVTAMTPDERQVLELIATGKEGEVPEDALGLLEEAGWVENTEEGFAITGGLFEGLVGAVAEGVIKVAVE
jgi:hypothetical protein